MRSPSWSVWKAGCSAMSDPERSLEPPEEKPAPRCPWCGEECETLYRDRFGVVFGCENCVDTLDAYENRHLAS